MPSGEYTNNINYYDIDYLDLLDDIPYKYIKSIVKQNQNEDDWVDFDFEVEIEDAVPTSEDRQMCSIKISFELEINVSNGSLPLMTTKSFVVIKEYHANSPMAMYVGENLWRWDEEDEDEDDDDDDDEEDDDDDEDVDADEPPQEPPQEPQQDDTDDDDDDDDEINVSPILLNNNDIYLRGMGHRNNTNHNNDIYDIINGEYIGQLINGEVIIGVDAGDISSVIDICV